MKPRRVAIIIHVKMSKEPEEFLENRCDVMDEDMDSVLLMSKIRRQKDQNENAG